MSEKYLIISNISKKNNVKYLIHAAAAYGFVSILVDWKTDIQDLRIDERASYIQMMNLREVRKFLDSKCIPLIGIEIMDSAESISTAHFPASVAIMPGNEGTGLSKFQKKMSDSFVFIPQYGSGTASLNVHIATTIIMHKISKKSTDILTQPHIESDVADTSATSII